MKELPKTVIKELEMLRAENIMLSKLWHDSQARVRSLKAQLQVYELEK